MKRNNGTLQDMVESILDLVDMSNRNFKDGDIFRTNSCTSGAQGMAFVFRYIGIEYDFGTYMDGDAHRVGYFSVDGVTLVKNGEINWKAYAGAVTDEGHGWANKELGIAHR